MNNYISYGSAEEHVLQNGWLSFDKLVNYNPANFKNEKTSLSSLYAKAFNDVNMEIKILGNELQKYSSKENRLKHFDKFSDLRP